MSQATAFDTHKSFKRLVETGIPEQQAEAIIDCQSGSQSELATKADIAGLKAFTKENIARLEGRMGKLEWMLGFNLALTAAVLLALIFK